MPKGRRVAVDNTQRALTALTEPVQGAPSLTPLFQNPRIQAIAKAFMQDASSPSAIPGRPASTSLSYEALSKLRTTVGRELEDATLVSDVPRSRWKALYGALSDDMREAAKATGPEAQRAWSRANTYTRAMMDRLDSIEHVVQKAGGPEKVFEAAISGTKEGATTLRAVVRSVPEDARKQLSAAMLKRMGRSVASQQNDTSDAFSVQTFLTNWNKLSPEAKSTLFNSYSGSFRMDMDKIAKVASNLREGAQVYANPPGTARALAQVGGWSTLAGSAATSMAVGNVGPLATVLGSLASANGLARFMTNPAAVRWLAKSTALPKSALAAQIPVLRSIGEKEDDEDIVQMADELEARLAR